MRSRVLAGIAALAALSFALTAALLRDRDRGSVDSNPPGFAQPNIVIILLDDLGYDDPGCYGGREAATPAIDRLAAEGMRFASFYANSADCSPSRAALMTGNYPQRYNIGEVIGPTSFRGIPGDVATLPSVLKRRGYRTVHIGKWHLGESRPEFLPSAHGYDESAIVSYDSRQSHYDPKLIIDGVRRIQETGDSTEVLTRYAAEFIERAGPRPFFLNLWYHAPHPPFDPPMKWKERYPDSPAGRYFALVADVDENVGRLLAAIRARGIEDDTIVILTSDNGAPTRTRDEEEDLRGAKAVFFEGGIRVPLIVRWPGHVPPGSESHAVVAGFDLLPTLAELCEVDVSDLKLDGASFAGILRGQEGRAGERRIFWNKKDRDEPDEETFAVRSGPWKLLLDRGRRYLFDFGAGTGLPSESDASDVSAAHPDIARALEDAYNRWRIETARLPYRIDRVSGEVKEEPPGVYHFSGNGGTVSLSPNRLFDFSDGDFTFSASLQLPPGNPVAQGAPPGVSRVIAEKSGSWQLRLIGGDRLEAEFTLDTKRSSKATLSAPIPRAREGEWRRIAFTVYGKMLKSKETYFKLFVDGRAVAEAETSDSVRAGGTGAGIDADDSRVLLGSGPGRVAANGVASGSARGPANGVAIGSGEDPPFLGGLGDVELYLAPLNEDQLAILESDSLTGRSFSIHPPGTTRRDARARGGAGTGRPPPRERLEIRER